MGIAQLSLLPRVRITALEFFFRKNWDVAVFIDNTLIIQWTMNSLIKLIEPIQYWRMAC